MAQRERHGDLQGVYGGGRRPPEYTCWKNMRRRCGNPAAKDYPRYGGRGIAVCEQWQRSYVAFLADVGRRPSPKHSLDRIENAGNYEPGNVRWATMREQRLNARPLQAPRRQRPYWMKGRYVVPKCAAPLEGGQ